MKIPRMAPNDGTRFAFNMGTSKSSSTAAVAACSRANCPPRWWRGQFSTGDYEGLGAAWEEFDAWVAAEGHTPRGDLWERYVVGPESNPDPAAWRTERNRPLTG